MAVRNDFAPGEVLAAADLNDTFASKLDLAGGKILQIVRATDTTDRTTTSTSFVDVTGMSVTITPQRNNSAILIISSQLIGNNAGALAIVQVTDNSNNVISGAGRGDERTISGRCTMIGYSTPATTSATTYKLRFRTDSGTATIFNSVDTGQLYAIEVSA